jgi:hypothetical protein
MRIHDPPPFVARRGAWRRMANVIKAFARHRDEMRLAKFQRVRGLDAEWKLLRRPTEYSCYPSMNLLAEASTKERARTASVRSEKPVKLAQLRAHTSCGTFRRMSFS